LFASNPGNYAMVVAFELCHNSIGAIANLK